MKATEGDAWGSGVPSSEVPPGSGVRTRPPGRTSTRARGRASRKRGRDDAAEGGHAIVRPGGVVSVMASDGQFLMRTSDGN